MQTVSGNIMTTIFNVMLGIIVTLLLGCGSYSGDTTNNDKTSPLVDTPRSFVKNYGLKDTCRLFAFVGENISVEAIPHKQGSMDNCFKAKFFILKEVYGTFPKDTIE